MNRPRDSASILLLGLMLGTGGLAVAESPAPAAAQSPTPEQVAACAQSAREEVFRDLAGLARYATANAGLQPPDGKERRVVFIGDSITDFWATVDPRFWTRADFVDRGISGQTTLQMLLRFRQDVIALRPAVVHILAGTNDIAGNTGATDLPTIEANIASMVDLARAHNIQVVIGSVLPASDFPWRPGLNPGPTIVALNEWLKSYSHAKKLTYVDYYAAMSNGALGMRSNLTADGVHPLLEGYRVMDPLVEAAVRAALRRIQ
jgi:lysophospholipase L1-like esterase